VLSVLRHQHGRDVSSAEVLGDAALGAVLAAVQPVGDFLGGVFEGFPDFAAQVASLIRSESAVIAEGRFTGTHNATGPVFRQRVAQLMCRCVPCLFSRRIGSSASVFILIC
jgi:hypothetical protein